MVSVQYVWQCSPDFVNRLALNSEQEVVLTSHRDLAPAANDAGVLGGLEARQLQAAVYAFLSAFDRVLLVDSQP